MAGGSAIRAGRAFVELFADSNKLNRAFDAAQRRVHQFAGAMGKVGAGIAGAGLTVLTPLAAIFRDTIGHFDKYNDTATKLGTSTEVFSRLVHGAEMSGAAFEDVETAAKFMQKSIADGDALGKIGIDAAKLKGLGLDEQFGIISDALKELDQESRTAAIGEVFGKGGGNLFKGMLNEGSAGLRAFAKESDRLGKTVNGIDAAKGGRVADAFDKAWGATKSTLREVGAAILNVVGEIEHVTEGIIDATGDLRSFIRENRQVVLTVAAVAAGMVVGGVALVGLAGAISVVTTIVGAGIVVLKGLAAVVGAILSPVGLAVIAVVALGAGLLYLFSQTEKGAEMFAGIKAAFGDFAEFIKGSWQGVTDAISAGDWKLAFQVGVATADVAWKGFVLGLQTGWNIFKGAFVDGWNTVVTGIKVAFIDMASFVLSNLAGTMKRMVEIYNANPLLPKKLEIDTRGMKSGDQIKAEFDADRQRVLDKAAADQAERDKSRGKALDEAEKAFVDASLALEELKRQAKEAAAAPKLVFGEGGDWGMPDAPVLPSVTQLSTTAKGIFGGNVAGQLGYGDTIPQETLAATKKTAANSDKQVALLEDIAKKEPEVWT